jgi:RHS repeat-associated protein
MLWALAHWSVISNSQVGSLLGSGSGRRIVKRVYPASGAPNVGYLRMVYSGSNVSFETDSTGTMGLKYTWGPGTDNLIAIQDAAGNHYYATTDRLGSVRTLAGMDGTWLLTRRWSPYGREMTRDSSASFTWGGRLRYGWTGREYDAETGLYFHRARYYSPVMIRFIQEDPVGSGIRPYAYVNGSPLEATDPSGMVPAPGGTTGAGRLWARAHLDTYCWNSPWCGRDDRDSDYDPFIPVADLWSLSYYYDIHRDIQHTVPNWAFQTQYFINDGMHTHRLDRGLVHSDAGYILHHDEGDWDRVARDLAARKLQELPDLPPENRPA